MTFFKNLYARMMSSPLPSSSSVLLPHLCSNASVLGLILAGELIALALTLVQSPLRGFSWETFGYISMVVQWIILLSALLLCLLSRWFSHRSVVVGGVSAYGMVMCIATVVLGAACWLMDDSGESLLKNIFLTAIFAGIFLRYLFLQQQLRQQQQAELQSRIQALHARIRPHFLFNAMNAVVSLIPVKPDLAEKMVEDLCVLFRASLQEVSLVPLEQELDLCRHYVDIEQVRLGERLRVMWNIQHQSSTLMTESILSVPSLVLQPLIENAIYHGIQRLPSGGLVTVETVIQAGSSGGRLLLISVTNPVPELKDNQTDTLEALEGDNGHHMALSNIQHRLQAHYGEKAAIKTQIIEGDSPTYQVVLMIPVEADSD